MSLSVIILSRDAGNLVPCVEAVQAMDPACRIIIVDDGAWEEAQHVLHNVWVVPGEKPFCFSRNVNIGIREAFSAPVTYDVTMHDACALVIHDPNPDAVIILNDDALLRTPGGFSAMNRLAQEKTEYGLIGASCNNVGNPNQQPQPGGGLRDEDRMLCFVCVLIPRRTLERVGLLDERFESYGLDDDDFSLRVRLGGLKLGVFDGCYVDHGSLESSYRRNPENTIRPNLTRFIEKWGVDNWGRTKETSEFPYCFPPEL